MSWLQLCATVCGREYISNAMSHSAWDKSRGVLLVVDARGLTQKPGEANFLFFGREGRGVGELPRGCLDPCAGGGPGDPKVRNAGFSTKRIPVCDAFVSWFSTLYIHPILWLKVLPG